MILDTVMDYFKIKRYEVSSRINISCPNHIYLVTSWIIIMISLTSHMICWFPHIILPEVSVQGEGGDVSVSAEEAAVRLLQLTVSVQNGILGQELQRRRVHQKHRQLELMDQPQELLQQMLD